MDIKTLWELWDCVQERWELGYNKVIHKEEGIEKLLQLVFNQSTNTDTDTDTDTDTYTNTDTNTEGRWCCLF